MVLMILMICNNENDSINDNEMMINNINVKKWN